LKHSEALWSAYVVQLTRWYTPFSVSAVADNIGNVVLTVRMPARAAPMSDDQFAEFCAANSDLRIERMANGDLKIMPPAFSRTGYQNADITGQLYQWAKRDRSGVGFDSSAGFKLPDTAIVAPDASWVRKSRLNALTPEQKKKYLPLCPDFVVELKSASDTVSELKDKMDQYIRNGALLGWLIDPDKRMIFVYRPDAAVVQLNHPDTISGDPELPGFVLDLTEIWNPQI
jgi:Uma2 family endonuclease